MLHVVARPEAAAVVQHCRGGKDRTGFGTMLLLGILGVEREALLEDYMLTGKNRLERNAEKMEIYKTYTSDQEVLDYLYSFIDTKQDFIEASMQEIEQVYGGIEEYVKEELGVTEEEIERLKELYLE